MTLTFKKGDMFAERADAIVNTVNCVGVMGKGVALEFKRRWPDNFLAYKRLCDARSLRPGHVFVFETGDMLADGSHRFLLNFPTKDHWRTKSRIEFIESGLDDLVVQVRALGIRSLVMPPLGCGNGGLLWDDVKDVITGKLASLHDVDIIVYEPEHHVPERRASRNSMNFERAVLLKGLHDLEVFFGGSLTRITMQKIVYFLQEAGVGFGLKFEAKEFGPYCEALKNVFRVLDEHELIDGFVANSPEVTVSRKGQAVAEEYLTGAERIRAEEIIKRVSLLVDGFESPYGMELLSSVHFLSQGERTDVASVAERMASWSPSKAEKYDAAVIGLAFDRLVEDRLIH